MGYRVLSEEQTEQFIERGWTQVEAAFPRDRALAAQDFLWDRLAERGVRREDRATWTEPIVHIQETYSDPVFQACATERLADAVEDLVGPGRWNGRDRTGNWGWWPVNFGKGSDAPWDVPTTGWHWDGQHFRHHVDSPEQGLLLLCMFSEIGPRGGGTLVAEGSHRIVARLLRRHPEGMEHRDAIATCLRRHPWLAELTGNAPPTEQDRVARFMDRTERDADGLSLRVVEITASPGDVFLCHPFLIHAASPNHSGVPRFMCNRTTPLRERMHLEGPDADRSPVEISIRRALAKDDGNS